MKVSNINNRPNQFNIYVDDINWYKNAPFNIKEEVFFSSPSEYPRVQQYYIESIFQSYQSLIAIKGFELIEFDNKWHKVEETGVYCLRDDWDLWVVNYKKPLIILDVNRWDYSTTTGRYRNIFLNENKKLTESKIKNNTYLLVDLNNYFTNKGLELKVIKCVLIRLTFPQT